MKNEEMLARRFARLHPNETAGILEQLPLDEARDYLASLPPESAAGVASSMAPLQVTLCIEGMDSEDAAVILSSLPRELAATHLRPVDQKQKDAILRHFPAPVAREIGVMLQYRESTAGALMDQRVFTVNDESSVGQTLESLKKNPGHLYYFIPVIDRERRFVGLTNLRDLMVAAPADPVAKVTATAIGRLSPTSTREAIIAHPGWRNYHELPVVDDNDVFLGLISYQTVRQLEMEFQTGAARSPAYDAGKALGELYWIGMTAIFKGAASLVTSEKKSPPAKGAS